MNTRRQASLGPLSSWMPHILFLQIIMSETGAHYNDFKMNTANNLGNADTPAVLQTLCKWKMEFFAFNTRVISSESLMISFITIKRQPHNSPCVSTVVSNIALSLSNLLLNKPPWIREVRSPDTWFSKYIYTPFGSTILIFGRGLWAYDGNILSHICADSLVLIFQLTG